jgi:hypothetical protein
VADPVLEQELDRCRAWLAENADLFLAASVHVQAVGQALRPDLAETDYDLALTALKYEFLLDAAETAEETLSLGRVVPLPRQVFAEAVTQFREEQERQQAAAALLVLAFARTRLRPRKAGRAGDPAPQPTFLKWLGPDGSRAFLRLPGEGETILVIRFFPPEGQTEAALPQGVWLAGVPGKVEGTAATFSLEKVQGAEQDLRLEVGPERVPWRPDPA